MPFPGDKIEMSYYYHLKKIKLTVRRFLAAPLPPVSTSLLSGIDAICAPPDAEVLEVREGPGIKQFELSVEAVTLGEGIKTPELSART